MKIKRFFAADIRQAMRMVKDELGPDAVIMSNKSVDGGVEIYAARDFDQQMLQQTQKVEQGVVPNKQNAIKKMFGLQQDAPPAKAPVHIVSSPRKQGAHSEQISSVPRRKVDSYIGYAEKAMFNRPDTRQIEASVQPAIKKPVAATVPPLDFSEAKYIPPAPQERVFNNVQQQQKPVEKQFAAAQQSAASEDLLAEMRNEFKQLKFSMAARLSELSFNSLQTNPVRMDVLHRLADMDISKKLSLKLVNHLGAYNSADSAFKKAQEMLAKVLPVSNDNILEYGGVVALLGPTGVGKTTTIAKLAAQFILKHGPRQVALITTDNFRIAAHEQLNTYGRILDVPVRSAGNAQELRSLINGFFDKKLILIDTAGMGPNDMRLAERLITLQENDIPVKSYLVMSATTQYKAMQTIVKGFQMVKPTGCIITKMDEAESKGAVISTLIEQQLPLVFITDGQQVPEDIHMPNAHRLVAQCVADLEIELRQPVTLGYEDWVAKGYA
ncbi:MAG: flagellar biosynthesis protein FlhF [Methylococcales bacterium]